MAAVFSLPRVVVEAENSLPALWFDGFGPSQRSPILRPCSTGAKKGVDISSRITKLNRIVYINPRRADLSRPRAHATPLSFCEPGKSLNLSLLAQDCSERNERVIRHVFENQTSCSGAGNVALRDNRLGTGESRHPGAASGLCSRRLPPLRWLYSRSCQGRAMPETERIRSQRRVPIGVPAKRQRCGQQKLPGNGFRTTNSIRDLPRAG
jgi:hypothetical protein